MVLVVNSAFGIFHLFMKNSMILSDVALFIDKIL